MIKNRSIIYGTLITVENFSSGQASRQKEGLQSNLQGLLRTLYNKHWKELCQYIAGKFGTPPDPEDVVQSAFERFSKLDQPEAVENPRAFLYKMSQNIVIDYHRAAKTRENHAQQVIFENSENNLDDNDPSNVLIVREKLTIVTKVIEQLPNTQRQLVILNRFHQISYAEISRRTGMSQTEIKRQVASALAMCSEAIEKQESAGKGFKQ
ncbi:RNA polymerase sigma factor [Aliikangiella coralliicola]|uniref:RNA polymerase sigma factor n=1 Tax=Aliikangiella coralliicola TaxID=2592383 RepID=A0A545UC30_9GAMM|nr:RNA polymerase sigma factor [Aliikangiella coralliicola]TQV87028.1 RNA polymerase sigma factor [Aliikangiella coralliicola]